MIRFTVILLIIISAFLGAAKLDAEDYQYQYFHDKKKEYVPFSDYIPEVRIHYYTVPHYLEDFYELYGMKQYYNENSLRENIERLKTALRCKFRHPSNALVKIESEKEYFKYRNLLFMHINIIIMRSYLKIAARFDKQSIKFYSSPFAKEIIESLDIADQNYKEAIPYWNEAVKYAKKASTVKITTDLGFIESERYSIVKGDLDFNNIINNYITKLQKKKEKLNSMLALETK